MYETIPGVGPRGCAGRRRAESRRGAGASDGSDPGQSHRCGDRAPDPGRAGFLGGHAARRDHQPDRRLPDLGAGAGPAPRARPVPGLRHGGDHGSGDRRRERRADVQLTQAAIDLAGVVVTALGQTSQQRALGTAQQTVQGVEIAQTQRENFINALSGRIAGVEVNSSSGVPGASTSIVIRGVSSISGSNQPLMIVDGLPVDNKTMSTGVMASDAGGSLTGLSNRGVDFTNRGSDFNPEDIESVTVLKGPEAAALYGIDAANGAIVITTKRGKAGTAGLEYSNSVRVEATRGRPEVQHTYGPSAVGSTTFLYFGTPYPSGTRFYDNIDGFFQTAVTQKHNLAFSGATTDSKLSYRVSTSVTQQDGVIPGSRYDRYNVTGSSRAEPTSWLTTDVSLQYSTDANDQPFKGNYGPLLGLLTWPDTINAKDFLTPAGSRKRLTSLAISSEMDNPYFSIRKNVNTSKTNRLVVNVGLTLTPLSWGHLKTNIGVDNYSSWNQLVRHPESALGYTFNGVLDETDDMTRNLNAQTIFNVNRRPVWKDIGVSGFLGHQVSEMKSTYTSLKGQDFLDPNFVSINNTNSRVSMTTIRQRRLVSAFAQATLDYKYYLYLTVSGRNDWTSTIPKGANSFFYPSVSGSFVFSDAFPSIGRFMTGKLRGAWAEVGKDARPYAYRPALEFKTTSYGGFGYGFWGPNLGLKPEFARSYEIGAELGFLDNRLGVDATYYRKQTRDQIVENIRGSYATGFILFNLNGAKTRNEGVEVTLRGTPIERPDYSWDATVNYTRARGKVISLPAALPESYNADTWLAGNVRNGTMPGKSTMSLTGQFYLRVDSANGGHKGELLIDPTTGLPLRSSNFIDGGYDRQPDFLVGITNRFQYKRWSLDFLVDIRRGGDVFNYTEYYLTARGLTKRTLDRETPRVIKGVLRDGKENTANPTVNTIVVVPAVQTNYYTGISEELFIEKDINWLRFRDVTLRYTFPDGFMRARRASVYVTATDLFLITNYSGLDPIVNGNTAAVGGSGGIGVDYGNFAMPRGLNFGFS
ncbi:MAG: SusC/RagA family TonB-linked outer membrane protein, partial [Armatimonadetes bacterium]|nr:SusC/RagA family TonB-linked outer membrane protein [Armatimonadota bacterium]